jgi:hypothetical protein
MEISRAKAQHFLDLRREKRDRIYRINKIDGEELLLPIF